MHEQDFPSSLEPLLCGDGSGPKNHIYAISSQEGTIARRSWELKLQETLGPEYVLIQSHTLMGIHLCIFIHRDLVWYTSAVDTCHVATKLGGMLRTKGAVGICMTVKGSSFLFVDSHLTAHAKNVQQRNDDFHTIRKSFVFPKYADKVPPGSEDVTHAFDFVIWMGDLNYRVDMKRATVEKLIKDNHWSLLLANDQLCKEREGLRVFAGFSEGRIRFPPTFKFDLSSHTYDTSTKQRVPSWTDRVLFRGQIACEAYGYVSSLTTSDHRPVYAILAATMAGGVPAAPDPSDVAAFDRVALAECMRRRAQSQGLVVAPSPAPRKAVPISDRPSFRDTVVYKSSICTIS